MNLTGQATCQSGWARLRSAPDSSSSPHQKRIKSPTDTNVRCNFHGSERLVLVMAPQQCSLTQQAATLNSVDSEAKVDG